MTRYPSIIIRGAKWFHSLRVLVAQEPSFRIAKHLEFAIVQSPFAILCYVYMRIRLGFGLRHGEISRGPIPQNQKCRLWTVNPMFNASFNIDLVGLQSDQVGMLSMDGCLVMRMDIHVHMKKHISEPRHWKYQRPYTFCQDGDSQPEVPVRNPTDIYWGANGWCRS